MSDKTYAQRRREFLDEMNPPRGGSAVPPKSNALQITVKVETDDILKRVLNLPEYGEVRIITHAGKVTFVETTTKEKVE